MYGKLVWYHVPTNSFWPHFDFSEAILDAGAIIPIPPIPKMSDIFKRVTDEYTKEIHNESTGVKVKYFFKSTPRDPLRVKRKLICRTVNGRSAVDEEVGSVTWEKKDNRMVINGIPDDLSWVCSEVSEGVGAQVGMLRTHPIREGLRAALEGVLCAIPAKPSGSIYFVPAGMVEELDRIAEAYNSLDNISVYSAIVDATNYDGVRLLESIARWATAVESDILDSIEKIENEDVDGRFILSTEKKIDAAIEQAELYSVIPDINNLYIDRFNGLKPQFENALGD